MLQFLRKLPLEFMIIHVVHWQQINLQKSIDLFDFETGNEIWIDFGGIVDK